MRVRLLSALTFGPGALLGLSEGQARRRFPVGSLEPVEPGLYRAMKPVQFKAGEVIGLHELPRSFESSVESLDAPTEEPVEATPAKKKRRA